MRARARHRGLVVGRAKPRRFNGIVVTRSVKSRLYVIRRTEIRNRARERVSELRAVGGGEERGAVASPTFYRKLSRYPRTMTSPPRDLSFSRARGRACPRIFQRRR